MFNSNYYIQDGEFISNFWSFNQNWFDILTIILTLFSLWFAYYLGNLAYRNDKRVKKEEHDELLNQEIDFLKFNLTELLRVIEDQVSNLKTYKKDTNSRLGIEERLQTNFMSSVDLKNVFEFYGYENEEQNKTINELFTSLSAIETFRNFLQDSVRNFISNYFRFQEGFYIYRKIIYKKLFETVRRRQINNPQLSTIINAPLFGEDHFAKTYFFIVRTTLRDTTISTPTGLNREKFMTNCITPLLELCQDHVPEDQDAIEVLDLADEVNQSWINMNILERAHKNEIQGLINSLEKAETSIKKFLQIGSEEKE